MIKLFWRLQITRRNTNRYNSNFVGITRNEINQLSSKLIEEQNKYMNYYKMKKTMTSDKKKEFNEYIHKQFGDFNSNGLLQFGNSNESLVAQLGNRNTSITSQNGATNGSFVSQFGNDNYSMVSQLGASNGSIVVQNSNLKNYQ
jgi:hypothetical protein